MQAQMVAGLAILEMYMLVAVLRLGRKGQAACNFEQAMEEYMLLNQMQRHPDAHPRPLALRAFERLLAMGLLTPADASARSAAALMHEPFSAMDSFMKVFSMWQQSLGWAGRKAALLP